MKIPWINVQMVYPGDLDPMAMQDELEYLIHEAEILPSEDGNDFIDGMVTCVNANHIRQWMQVRDRPDLICMVFEDGDMMFVKHEWDKLSELLA